MKILLSLVAGVMLGIGVTVALASSGLLKILRDHSVSISMDLSNDDIERISRAAETQDGQTMVLSEGKTVHCAADHACEISATVR